MRFKKRKKILTICKEVRKNIVILLLFGLKQELTKSAKRFEKIECEGMYDMEVFAVDWMFGCNFFLKVYREK